ncbi:hypothetical protein [Paenibacillus sp. PK1-4R]|uniref:hypothetical protein n=1 Tax=Paenibacillus sp. PK1-4R TaxID=3049075 RepID=UPI0025A1604D|nr:hypothetical protein [Paenibacillus sp. PK1-4R]WJM09520.1 hypothetical protein QNO02_06170 [Paenibacillus sp. PK1-4R]
MPDTAVKIYANSIPFTGPAGTLIYTGKANTTCILKSIVICNTGSTVSPRIYIMINSNRFLVGGKQLKPYETLVIPVSDIIIGPSETMHIYQEGTPGVANIRISAIERDGTPTTLGLSTSRLTLNASGIAIIPSASDSSKRLVKSLVICNTDSVVRTINIRFGGTGANLTLISNYKLAPYDTILIPFTDILLTSGEFVEGSADSSVVSVHVVTQVVT